MKRTVKDLIRDLLYYPMDAEVVIAINGESEHIFEIAKFENDDKVYLEIERSE